MESTTQRRRFRNIVGPAIRRSRNAKGLTQAELAAKIQIAGLDLGRAEIAKIESQLRSLYDFELLVFAEVLGINLLTVDFGVKRAKATLQMLRKGYK